MEKVFNSAEYKTRFTTEVSYGELVSGATVKLFLPFKNPNELCDIPTNQLGSKIVDYIINCPCSDGFSIREDGIEVNFNSGRADTGVERGPYWSTIRLFLEDDKKLKVPNNIGQLVYNPDKANVTLELYGTIRKTQ